MVVPALRGPAGSIPEPGTRRRETKRTRSGRSHVCCLLDCLVDFIRWEGRIFGGLEARGRGSEEAAREGRLRGEVPNYAFLPPDQIRLRALPQCNLLGGGKTAILPGYKQNPPEVRAAGGPAAGSHLALMRY